MKLDHDLVHQRVKVISVEEGWVSCVCLALPAHSLAAWDSEVKLHTWAPDALGSCRTCSITCQVRFHHEHLSV